MQLVSEHVLFCRYLAVDELNLTTTKTTFISTPFDSSQFCLVRIQRECWLPKITIEGLERQNSHSKKNIKNNKERKAVIEVSKHVAVVLSGDTI